jgi:glycosyltransferase involved in cell wall biosynthesis
MIRGMQDSPLPKPDSSMSASPLFSVCIPTFNGASTIEESIKSVLSQTCSSFEIIISDDGSSDDTLELVSKFDDSRILVEVGPASGAAEKNWNHAISLARGRYVKVMGQDDVLYPDALETELAMFEMFSESGAVMTFSKRDLLSPSGQRLPRLLSSAKRFPRVNNLDSLLPRIVRSGRNPLGEPVCVTARRDALQNTTGFNGTYLIDLTTWIKLLEHGPGLFIETPQCGFRVSRNSWSYALRQSQARQTRELIRYLKTRFPESVSRLDVLIGSLNATLAQVVRAAVLGLLSKRYSVKD